MTRPVVLIATTAAALILSSAAFAGNNQSTVDQYGTGQQITIDQTGGNFDAVGSVGRSVQQDDGNYAGYGNNYLAITQTGSGNSFGFESFSGQSGAFNRATISQAGQQSSVETVQTGYANGGNSGSGEGYVVQDGSASLSDVNATSSGSYNVFQVSQGGTDNRTQVQQVGSYNLLNINQGTGYGGDHNRISATQNGTSNSGSIYQISTTNTTTLGQTGNYNQAIISQASTTNTATLNQNGNYNAGTIRQ